MSPQRHDAVHHEYTTPVVRSHEATGAGCRLSIAYRQMRCKATIHPCAGQTCEENTDAHGFLRMVLEWKTIDPRESISIRENPCALIMHCELWMLAWFCGTLVLENQHRERLPG